MINDKVKKFDNPELIWIHIPKNVSTTIRNWINLQNDLPDIENMGDDIDEWTFRNGVTVQNPHHDRVWNSIFNKRITSLREFKSSNHVKLLVFRNPYKRFASAIADKYFSFPNKIEKPGRHHLNAIGLSNKNPYNVTILEIARAMEKTSSMWYNQHWLPQYMFFEPLDLDDFDYIILTSRFNEEFNEMCEKEGFPKLDSDKSKRVTPYSEVPDDTNISTKSIGFIRDNYGVPSKDDILSPLIKDIIKDIYEIDFNIYNKIKEMKDD